MSIPNINLAGGSGIPAVGSILAVGNNGSPLLYNDVGNASNIKMGLKAEQADTTNMGTVWKQSIPTLLDAGTMTVELHFIPDSVGQDNTTGLEGHGFSATGALGDIFAGREIRPWKITWPDGTFYIFNAFILDYPIDANVTKDLMINMTLQITGQPTFA